MYQEEEPREKYGIKMYGCQSSDNLCAMIVYLSTLLGDSIFVVLNMT